MATATERKYISDLVKYEEERMEYSRDTVTIASGQNLSIGAVLGKKTADGKYYALNPTATDGTQNALCVLAQDTDASAADKKSIVIARHAILARNAVVWPSGITDAQKSTAINQLGDRGIIIRDAA